jgi:hypothetical protein
LRLGDGLDVQKQQQRSHEVSDMHNPPRFFAGDLNEW